MDKDKSLLLPWFVKTLQDDGGYHLIEIISQQVYLPNEKVLGLEHLDILNSRAELVTIFLYQYR